jgi:hypothetical protein
MVLAQAEKYNKLDHHGHLYGAIIASVRDYLKKRGGGKYAEYHMAFCAHYVGDLLQGEKKDGETGRVPPSCLICESVSGTFKTRGSRFFRDFP